MPLISEGKLPLKVMTCGRYFSVLTSELTIENQILSKAGELIYIYVFGLLIPLLNCSEFTGKE